MIARNRPSLPMYEGGETKIDQPIALSNYYYLITLSNYSKMWPLIVDYWVMVMSFTYNVINGQYSNFYFLNALVYFFFLSIFKRISQYGRKIHVFVNKSLVHPKDGVLMPNIYLINQPLNCPAKGGNDPPLLYVLR